MSVTVSERKVDEKRRITLPQSVEIRKGATVVMIASKDAAVVASNRTVAEKLTKVLHEIEKDAKNRAIDEWARLIEEAGLSGLKAKDIDRAVDQSALKKVERRTEVGHQNSG